MSKENIMNTYGRVDVVFKEGNGCKIWDVNNKEYLDFVSGIATNCLGHSSLVVLDAISRQSKKLMHISNLYWSDTQMELAKKLASLSHHERVFFCNSGAEAIECALKLARKYGKIKNKNKDKILYMKNSFHGRTLGALSVTGQKSYQKDFMPLIPNTIEIEFNNIDDLKENFNDSVCGIILEPIQGEGGIINVNNEYLKTARDLCNKYDALLIFDEVQCGIGRIGTLFAYESFSVVPDVICMAKGLGGGFPIGAVLGKEDIVEAFVPGDHGSTFGGNPLACAVSLAVLNEITTNNILDNVKEQGEYICNKLNKLKEKYSIIEDIKGQGLLLGIKVSVDTKEFVKKAFEKGLLLAGAGQNVVRILPPLNVKQKDIDEALILIEEVLKEF